MERKLRKYLWIAGRGWTTMDDQEHNVGGQITVDIQVEEDRKNRFHFLSTIGQAEAPTEAQLRNLLDANLFGQGTGEAALAYDPDMEEIVLQRCFDARYADLVQLMAAA